MISTRTLLVAAVAAGCCGIAGCYVTPTDVKPAIDAQAVADGYNYAPGADPGLPTDKQLKPIERVVVLPFIYDTWKQDDPEITWLPARRLDSGESVPYPLTIHVCPVFEPNRWLAQGVIVCARDCWPAVFTQNYSGGPSRWKSPFVVWLVLGARGTMQARLYQSSRPFGDDVHHAGKAKCTELILRDHVENLFQSVDDSLALGPADRMLVYECLSAYLEQAWKEQTDPARKKIWVRARQALREKLVLISVPKD